MQKILCLYLVAVACLLWNFVYLKQSFCFLTLYVPFCHCCSLSIGENQVTEVGHKSVAGGISRPH
jgi:hypothetical protein